MVQPASLQLYGTPPILDCFIDYFMVQPALLQLLGIRQSLTISLSPPAPAGFAAATWNPPILVFFIDYFIVQPGLLQLLGTRHSLTISLTISLSSRLSCSHLEPANP